MIDPNEIIETIRMIESENLDIRTITMGISLRDCADAAAESARRKIYDKITYHAEHLVKVGDRGRRALPPAGGEPLSAG